MSLLKVENLTKQFEYYEKGLGLKESFKNIFSRKKLVKEAVNRISFSIEEGEIVGFLGPNGAGKTTTLKMLSGILYPTDGTATILGYTPWERKVNFKKQIAIVMGQRGQLIWDLPAIESLYLNKCIYEIDNHQYKKTVDELISLLDVEDLLKVQVRRLSLGERMKFELISALLHKPKVIFLDEPTIGLDLFAQKNIRDFLKEYNKKEKTTIMLTSHYMDDIQDLCKRIIIINEGAIVCDDQLEQIANNFNQTRMIKVQLADGVDGALLSKYGNIKELNGSSVKLELKKEDIHETTKNIFNTYNVADYNIENISIEDVIGKFYSKAREK